MRKPWLVKWLKRQAYYSLFTWPLVSAVYFPYNEWIVGLSLDQWIRWLSFGIPQALLANLIIGPYTKYIWQWVWKHEHASAGDAA